MPKYPETAPISISHKKVYSSEKVSIVDRLYLVALQVDSFNTVYAQQTTVQNLLI